MTTCLLRNDDKTVVTGRLPGATSRRSGRRRSPSRKSACESFLRVVLAVALALPGCANQTTRNAELVRGNDPEENTAPNDILHLNPEDLCEDEVSPELGQRPHTIKEDDLHEGNLEPISLDAAIQQALANTKVLRDLGGTILSNPDRVETKHSPSIVESDPRFGVEAALSDFDAHFTASGNFEKNDRVINNIFFGGGTRFFTQDLNVYQTQLSKTAATGTRYYLRNFTDYNSNNAPGNLFYGSWNSNVELEFRHPLLRGGGVDFNRIAGTSGTPGFYNGVLIARVNAKISQHEFELALRDFISNVSNAYWDLYFAYRDLDAKLKARDKSYESWQTLEALSKQQQIPEERVALAEEQYFRFQEDVENSLSGKVFDGTRTFNGTTGGTFRAQGGVLVAERRLRLLIGFPISAPKLLQPCDEPSMAEMVFEFDASAAETVARRPELKRQRLKVQRREMELVASRNFLKPQLDATGRYRYRGFGKDLAGSAGRNSSGDPDLDSAWGNLVAGNFQEWQLGFELDIPLGFRRAHAAVHTAELQLAREKAVLFEQERQVIHDLNNALAELDRAYIVSQTNLNRYRASKKLVENLEKRNKLARNTVDQLDRLLDAHRRLADSESRYFLAKAEYEVAVKNVYFEKGAILEYHNLSIMDTNAEPVAPAPAAARRFENVSPRRSAVTQAEKSPNHPRAMPERANPAAREAGAARSVTSATVNARQSANPTRRRAPASLASDLACRRLAHDLLIPRRTAVS
jgi:Outer membrane efflux protein